jgi:hypothetical protein
MSDWATAKSRSDAYWATRAQAAQQVAIRKAAVQAWHYYNRRVERRNIENIPGRIADSLSNPSMGNILANGAANLVDALDWVGETFREGVLGHDLDTITIPVKPVPMPTERRPTGTLSA